MIVCWTTSTLWISIKFLSISERTVAYEGECNQCSVACIEIYDPVCSVDSTGTEKNWGSQCEFDSYNCRYPYDGKSIDYFLEFESIKQLIPIFP